MPHSLWLFAQAAPPGIAQQPGYLKENSTQKLARKGNKLGVGGWGNKRLPVLLSSPVRAPSSYLGVSTDGFLALDAGVGTDLVKALDAAVAALLLHILLALQVVAAVIAVKALRHGAHAVTAGPCGREGGKLRMRKHW